MNQIFDEDSAIDVWRENRAYDTYLRKEENRIIHIHDMFRKIKSWRQLHPKWMDNLAIEGLSKEELLEIENNVY